MTRLVWTEAMSVGVEALDADHRCLLRIIGLLQDVAAEDEARVVEMVLDTLTVYCRYHFGREEQVMRACGFPGRGVHEAEHDGFARLVAGLRERLRGGGEPVTAEGLRECLADWLRHHILIQDMAYKPYVADAAPALDTLPFIPARGRPRLRAAPV